MNKATLTSIIAAAFAFTAFDAAKADDTNKTQTQEEGILDAGASGCGSDCGSKKGTQGASDAQAAGKNQQITTGSNLSE